MREIEGLGELADEAAALERALGGARGVTEAFGAEVTRLGRNVALTGREVAGLSTGFGSGLRRAFDGVVFDGMRLSDALKGLAASMADNVYSMAMKPVQGALGSALAEGVAGLFGGGFAQGAAFSRGRVEPFANGGVVQGPTAFPMAGGRLGLMGEAGPEAILPLARGTDGRLGVRAEGGAGARPVSVVINVTTPDTAGFARAQGQIAAEVARLVARGQRNS